MNVTCPNCASVYRVDPAKVPEAGVRARCAVCSAVFAVRREAEPTRAGASPVAAELSRPAVKEPSRPEPPPRAEPPRAEPPRPEPARTEPARAAPAAAPRPTQPPPSGPPPRPAPPRPAIPAAPPGPAVPAAPAAPAASLRPAAPFAGPPASTAKPSAPTQAAAPSSPPRAAPVPGGRPANPFLSQDPALKARRLARALISDMVVYHPGKRQEGLRDGNLKELFEEEIKKSWEEYAEQVGRDVAESTAYFREALNEILAGGRQIF